MRYSPFFMQFASRSRFTLPRGASIGAANPVLDLSGEQKGVSTMDLQIVSGPRSTGDWRTRLPGGADEPATDQSGTPIDAPAAIADFSTWSVGAAGTAGPTAAADRDPAGQPRPSAPAEPRADAPPPADPADGPDTLHGRAEPVGAILDRVA